MPVTPVMPSDSGEEHIEMAERMVAPARRRYTPMMAPWLRMQKKYGAMDAYIVYLLARGMNEGQIVEMVKGAGGCVMGPDGKPISVGVDVTAEYVQGLAVKERKTIHRLALTIVDEMEWGRALAGVTMAQERMLQVLANPAMSTPEQAGTLVKIMNAFNSRLVAIRDLRESRDKLNSQPKTVVPEKRENPAIDTSAEDEDELAKEIGDR